MWWFSAAFQVSIARSEARRPETKLVGRLEAKPEPVSAVSREHDRRPLPRVFRDIGREGAQRVAGDLAGSRVDRRAAVQPAPAAVDRRPPSDASARRRAAQAPRRGRPSGRPGPCGSRASPHPRSTHREPRRSTAQVVVRCSRPRIGEKSLEPSARSMAVEVEPAARLAKRPLGAERPGERDAGVVLGGRGRAVARRSRPSPTVDRSLRARSKACSASLAADSQAPMLRVHEQLDRRVLGVVEQRQMHVRSSRPASPSTYASQYSSSPPGNG